MPTTTDFTDELQDKQVHKTTRLDKLSLMVWDYKPMIGICGGLFILGSLAAIIVLSLIPTYFQPTDFAVYHPPPFAYVLNYATDVSNLGSLSVASLIDLANSLMKGVSLSPMTVNSAQFVSPSGKKRRALDTQCETNSSTLNGAILRIRVTLQYPPGCNTIPCQRKYIATVDKHLKTLYPSLSLLMTLTNGQTINVKMSLCSLVQDSTNSCSTNSTDDSTCSSSTIRVCSSSFTDETCSTPTCSPTCQNGGTCFESNMCACTSDWTGPSCATAICSPCCSNGGVCSSPGVCTCATGWSGSDCTTPICISPACTPNQGTCVAPDSCSCAPGWGDPDCSQSTTCYYGEDQVDLVDGEQRSIKDLQVGDRVWSISPDGRSYVEDEIIILAQNEPNTTTIFYTIKTIAGHHVSLTSFHVIPVYVPAEDQIKLISASEVTVQHHLIMFNQKVEIQNISIDARVGYFAPLTQSGYLLVNNISTSVYSARSKVSTKILHRIVGPLRTYYHLMRWIYGNEYNPYETNVKEGFHPIIQLVRKHSLEFLIIDILIQYIFPTLFIIYILHLFSRSLLK